MISPPSCIFTMVQATQDTLQRALTDTASVAAITNGQNPLLFVLGIANLIVLGVSAGFIYKEIKSNHDWNRRRTAHDLIFETCVGRFHVLRNQLALRIEHKLYDPDETSATLSPELTSQEYRVLEALLNYLENVCLAVKNNVVDEDIAYECLGAIMVGYRRWAAPYVRKCREIDRLFWIQIDPVAKRWNDRRQKVLSKMEEGEQETVTRVIEKGKERL